MDLSSNGRFCPKSLLLLNTVSRKDALPFYGPIDLAGTQPLNYRDYLSLPPLDWNSTASNRKWVTEMKYPFVLTLITCFAFLTGSQTPSGSSANSKCTLTREQSPEIRGIRLGMSAEQLRRLFPESNNQQTITDAIANAKKVESYGESRLTLQPDPRTPNPRFAGVNFISVELLDERVTRFSVQYVGPEWNNVQEFVAKLSEGLKLPTGFSEGNDSYSNLKCDGFKIDAYVNRGSTQSSVYVVDTVSPQVVEDRREAAREKSRRTFKP